VPNRNLRLDILQGAQITQLLQKGCAKGVDFEYLRYVCEVFWWFYIINIFNFTKGTMPKLIIELNLGRKYSNPHLNLNTS
jgi:hypothetical protein